MAFTIPDNDEAFDRVQSIIMQTDLNCLVAGVYGNGVISGCLVAEQGSPDMTVQVSSGEIQFDEVRYAITGGNVTISAAHASQARIDLVVAATSDTLSAVAGTPAVYPKAPDIPASSVLLAMVLVPPSETAIETVNITDKRVEVYPRDVGAILTHNAAQTVPDTTPTVLSFNTETRDTDGFHSGGSPTRITIPSGRAGIYHVHVEVEWESNNTGYREVQLLLGGATLIAESNTNAISGQTTRQSVSTIRNFSAGNYFEVQVYQDSSGDLDVLSTSDISPEFIIQKVG